MIGASEAGRRLLESLTKLVNLVLKGTIPEDIQPIFFGANLCALSKKDGGIRPIAVGSTLRRLITKVGFKPISQQLGLFFRPHQLGYDSKGGSKASAHAARHYLTSNTQNKVFLKLDIKNAFNCLNRGTLLQKVKNISQAFSIYSGRPILNQVTYFIRITFSLQRRAFSRETHVAQPYFR